MDRLTTGLRGFALSLRRYVRTSSPSTCPYKPLPFSPPSPAPLFMSPASRIRVWAVAPDHDPGPNPDPRGSFDGSALPSTGCGGIGGRGWVPAFAGTTRGTKARAAGTAGVSNARPLEMCACGSSCPTGGRSRRYESCIAHPDMSRRPGPRSGAQPRLSRQPRWFRPSCTGCGGIGGRGWVPAFAGTTRGTKARAARTAGAPQTSRRDVCMR